MNAIYHVSTLTLLAVAIGSVPLTVNPDSSINTTTTMASSINNNTPVANDSSSNTWKSPNTIEQLLIGSKGNAYQHEIQKTPHKTSGKEEIKSLVPVIESGIKMAHEFIESSAVRSGRPDVMIEGRGSIQQPFEQVLENLPPNMGQGQHLENVNEFKGIANSVLGTFVDGSLKKNNSKPNDIASNRHTENVNGSNVVSSGIPSQPKKSYIHVSADVQVLIKFLSSTFGPNTYMVDIVLRLQEITGIVTRAFTMDCSPVARGVKKLMDITVCIFAGNPESAMDQLEVFMETQYAVFFRQIIGFFNISERTAADFLGKVRQIFSLVGSLFGGDNNLLDIFKSMNGGNVGDRTGGRGGKGNSLDELGIGQWASRTTSGVLNSRETTGGPWRQDVSDNGQGERGFTKGGQWETTASSVSAYSVLPTRNQDTGGGQVGDSRERTDSNWSEGTADAYWTEATDGVDYRKWTTRNPGLTDEYSEGVDEDGSTDGQFTGGTPNGVDEYGVTTDSHWTDGSRSTALSNEGHSTGYGVEDSFSKTLGNTGIYWTDSDNRNYNGNGGSVDNQWSAPTQTNFRSTQGTTGTHWTLGGQNYGATNDEKTGSHWTTNGHKKSVTNDGTSESYWTSGGHSNGATNDGTTDSYRATGGYSNDATNDWTTGSYWTTGGHSNDASNDRTTGLRWAEVSPTDSAGKIGATGNEGITSFVNHVGPDKKTTVSQRTGMTDGPNEVNTNDMNSFWTESTKYWSDGMITSELSNVRRTTSSPKNADDYSNGWGIKGTSIGKMGTGIGNMGMTTGNMGTTTGSMGMTTGNMGKTTGTMGTSTRSVGMTTKRMETTAGIIVMTNEKIGMSNGNMGTTTRRTGMTSDELGVTTGSMGIGEMWTTSSTTRMSDVNTNRLEVSQTTEDLGLVTGSHNGISWKPNHNTHDTSATTPAFVDSRVAEKDFSVNTIDAPKSTGFVAFILKVERIVQLVQTLLSGKKHLYETAVLGKELLDSLTPLFNLEEKSAVIRHGLDFLDRAACVLRRTPLEFIKRDVTKIAQETQRVSKSVLSLLRAPPSTVVWREFTGQVQQLFTRISCLLDSWNNEFPFEQSSDMQR